MPTEMNRASKATIATRAFDGVRATSFKKRSSLSEADCFAFYYETKHRGKIGWH